MTNVPRTIKIGKYGVIATIAEFCSAIEKAGGTVTGKAREVMINPAFTLLSKGYASVDLVIIDLDQFVFKGSISIANIYNEAGKAGLGLCSARTGPELCLHLMDNQDEGSTEKKELIIAMDPIMDYSSNDYVVFKITHDNGKLCLDVCHLPHNKVFPQDSFLWVFRDKTG